MSTRRFAVIVTRSPTESSRTFEFTNGPMARNAANAALYAMQSFRSFDEVPRGAFCETMLTGRGSVQFVGEVFP